MYIGPSMDPFAGQLSFAKSSFYQLLDSLSEQTALLDRSDAAWPEQQFLQLAEEGVLGWVIPEEYGGNLVSQAELNAGYELLTEACLCTCFVLTQYHGACQRIAGSQNESLKRRLLPELGSGTLRATVGISHLTTSQQHFSKPAVEAIPNEEGFLLTGMIPWVTNAEHSDYIVTGATCPDGRQILAALPTALDNVTVLSSAQMLSLTTSQTASIQLDSVQLTDQNLIAGPVEQIMKQGIGGKTGSLSTSALAVGHSRNALKRLGEEAERRPDLVVSYESLEAERQELSKLIWELNSGVKNSELDCWDSQSIRQKANSLVLRATQAYLTATKGRGFVKGHPAERLLREAMFFLVWSCPQPVAEAAMREFACLET